MNIHVNNTKVLQETILVHKKLDAEQYVIDKYKSQGKQCSKSRGETGIPDLSVYGDSGDIEFYIEVKTGNDSLRPSQMKWIHNHPEAQVVVYYVDQINYIIDNELTLLKEEERKKRVIEKEKREKKYAQEMEENRKKEEDARVKREELEKMNMSILKNECLEFIKLNKAYSALKQKYDNELSAFNMLKSEYQSERAAYKQNRYQFLLKIRHRLRNGRLINGAELFKRLEHELSGFINTESEFNDFIRPVEEKEFIFKDLICSMCGQEIDTGNICKRCDDNNTLRNDAFKLRITIEKMEAKHSYEMKIKKYEYIDLIEKKDVEYRKLKEQYIEISDLKTQLETHTTIKDLVKNVNDIVKSKFHKDKKKSISSPSPLILNNPITYSVSNTPLMEV